MKHKKLLLLPVLVLACLPIHAQFKKGDKMAGASVASVLYNSGRADIAVATIGNNISVIKNYSVNIVPSFAWFVSDNTAIVYGRRKGYYGIHSILVEPIQQAMISLK